MYLYGDRNVHMEIELSEGSGIPFAQPIAKGFGESCGNLKFQGADLGVASLWEI